MAPAKSDAEQSAETKAEAEHKMSELFFDMAEAMENAGARGLISDSALPPAPGHAAQEHKFTVRSSKEESWKKLVNYEGDTLLIAKPAGDGSRFNIYVSRTAKKPLAPRPLFSRSFSLTSSCEKGEWILSSLFCERCESVGRRTCGRAALAQIRCHAEPGVAGAARGLDVELPAPSKDGLRASMCTVCGDPGAAWATELTTRAAHSKGESLQLERTAISCGGVPCEPCLRFDQAAGQESTLTYDAPLGIVQAFAVSLVASSRSEVALRAETWSGARRALLGR